MTDDGSRELFMRGLWRGPIPDSDPAWVERVGQLKGNDGPLGDYGPLVKSMLDRGVPASDIARLARIVAYEAVFGVLYHLEDSHASYEDLPEDSEERAWAVFEVDPETLDPLEQLPSLHEDLLGSDPSGREMRPDPS